MSANYLKTAKMLLYEDVFLSFTLTISSFPQAPTFFFITIKALSQNVVN